MEKVAVTKLTLVGENDKGQTFQGDNSHGEDFLLIHREAGTLNGCHFHKGLSPAKNPEILLIISGEAELYCQDLASGEERNFRLEPYDKVAIFPWVWHELKAVSAITFLEMNNIASHQQDTFYEKVFR